MTPAECAAISPRLHALLRAHIAGEKEEPGLWGPPEHAALFNLAEDPGAQHNVLEAHPDRARAMRAVLRALQDRCPPQLPLPYKATRDADVLTPEERAAAGIPEAGTPPDDQVDEDLEKLKALGYL